MITPIYQIAAPMADWWEVPKHIYDEPALIQRKGSPALEYRKRIVVEVSAAQLQMLQKIDKAMELVELKTIEAFVDDVANQLVNEISTQMGAAP